MSEEAAGIDLNDSLRWLHGRPPEWTRSSVNQFRVFLVYNPHEFSEESRTLWEIVLPQLQNYACKFGLQVSFLDAFLNLPAEVDQCPGRTTSPPPLTPETTTTSGVTRGNHHGLEGGEEEEEGGGEMFVSPADLRLLIKELEDCAQHAHRGCFFLFLVGTTLGPRVFPSSINENDWNRLKKVAQSINKDGLKHLESMYQPSTERLKTYELVPHCLNSKISILCNMYFSECLRRKECSFQNGPGNSVKDSALFQLVKAGLACKPQGCLLVDMDVGDDKVDNTIATHDNRNQQKKTTKCSFRRGGGDSKHATESSSNNNGTSELQVSQHLRNLIDKHPGCKWFTPQPKSGKGGVGSGGGNGSRATSAVGSKRQVRAQEMVCWVVATLTNSIRESAAFTRVEEITSHSVMSQVLHSQEIIREQLAFPWEEMGREEQEEGLRRHLIAGATSLHQPALIHGGQAHGKTRQMVRALEICWQLFSNEEVMSLVVFLRNSTHFLTFRNLVSYLTQCLLFFDGDDSSAILTSKYTDTEKLEELLKELSQDTSRYYCLLLDDVDELYGRASPEDQQLLLAFLSMTLPPKTYIFATVTCPSSKTAGRLLIDTWKQQRSESLHGLLLPVVEIGTATLCSLAITAFSTNPSGLSFVYKRLEFSAGSSEKMEASLRQLLQVLCSCRTPTTDDCGDKSSSNNSDSLLNQDNNSAGLHVILQNLYAHFPVNLVDSVIRYICSARKGLSQMELLDLLSCDEQMMPSSPDLFSMYRFPLLIWLRLKHHLAPLLRWQLRHGRYLMYPASRPLAEVMRASLFTGSAQVRQVHQNLSNLFLSLFASSMELNGALVGSIMTKGSNLIIGSERDGSRRGSRAGLYSGDLSASHGDGMVPLNNTLCTLGPQQVMYSEASLNPRRAEELWYHLMLSGDLVALKKYSFFHLGYLIAVLRLWSPVYLLSCLDYALTRVLDSELQLLRQGILLFAELEDADVRHLSGIVISRFRSVKDIFPALDQLVRQSMEWYDSQIEPILVPLVSWCEPPLLDQAALITPKTGELRAPILSTVGGQHVVCLAGRGAYMFHIASGTLVRRFSAEGGNSKSMPNTMCFSHDCRRLYLGTNEGSLQIFDVNSGGLLNSFDIHKKAVTCLWMCLSGEHIYTGSEDTTVQKVCLFEESVLSGFQAHVGNVTCLALNTRETLLITGSQDSKVKVWYTEDFTLLIIFEDLTAPVVCMSLSNENTFLLIACSDGTVSMKCPTAGNHIHNLEGHRGKVSSLCVVPESSLVMIGGRDGICYLHNLYTGKLVRTLPATTHGEPILAVKTLQDKRYAVILHANSLRVVNLNLEMNCLPVTFSSSAHIKSVRAIALSQTGKLGLSGCATGQVHVWSLDTIVLRATLEETNTGPITCLDISLDGVWLATGGELATCVIYERMSLKQAGIFQGHTAAILHIFFLADNSRILSVDRNGKILIWSTSGDTLLSLDKVGQSYTISPDRENLVICNSKTIELWNLEKMEHLRSHTTPEDSITCVRFSPDGRMLLLADEGKAVTVLESTAWSLSQILSDVHTAPLTCLTGDNNEDLVISGDTTGLIIVWRVDSGEDLLRLQGHSQAVTTLQITRDDLYLLSGSLDGYVKIWRLKTASCLSSFQASGAILTAVMDPDARRILLHIKDLNRLGILCLYNSPVSSAPSSPVGKFKRFKIRGGRDERRPTHIVLPSDSSSGGFSGNTGAAGPTTEPGGMSDLTAISLKCAKRPPPAPGPAIESLQITFERQDRLILESISKPINEVASTEQPILTDGQHMACGSIACAML